MNQNEAQRIAGSINILRPEWPTKLLMTVLADERMIRRPYADAVIALTLCALDPSTQKPGRVHEAGPWWSIVTAAARGGSGMTYREVIPGVCVICNAEWQFHDKFSGHQYDNPLDRGRGVGPTPEQKAAIQAARIEAEKARTAAREDKPKREPRDPAEVVAEHTSQPEEKTA